MVTLLFTLFTAHFSISMLPQKLLIKPDSFKMELRSKAISQSNDILNASLDYYETYMIDTTKIATISFAPLIHPDGSKAIGYEATLYNGNQITGFYFKTGPYKNEIWALFWPLVEGERGDPFPIPHNNFSILQSFYKKHQRS